MKEERSQWSSLLGSSGSLDLVRQKKGASTKEYRVPKKYATHFTKYLGLILVIISSEVVATYTALSSSWE